MKFFHIPKLNHISLFSCLLLTCYIILALLILRSNSPVSYGDTEQYYIAAGLAYLKGNYTVNPEHPPLAKYIIALYYMYVSRDLGILSILFSSITLLFLYKILHLLFKNTLEAFILALILITNTLFLHVSVSCLLDVFYISFLIVALYFLLKYLLDNKHNVRSILTSTIALGLALGCKITTAIFLTAIIFFIIVYAIYTHNLRKTLYSLLLLSTIPMIVYFLSFLHFIMNGMTLLDVIERQWFMITYHSKFHHPTFYTIFNALVRLFFNFVILKYYSLGHIELSLRQDSMLQSLTITLSQESYVGLGIKFYAGLGSIINFLFLPSLLYVTYTSILKRKSNHLLITCLLVASLIQNIPTISIDWYFYPSIIFFHIATYIYLREYLIKDLNKRYLFLIFIIILNILGLALTMSDLHEINLIIGK